jgi:hypothetical protein
VTDQTMETAGVQVSADGGAIPAAAAPQPCSCAAQDRSFIYALGRVAPRFPSIGVEKEFAQASGRAETAALTDGEVAQTVLRSNRYLARQLCWVLSIEGLETYVLVPRESADLDVLVSTMRTAPRGTDVDVVIGIRGPMSAPESCNGLAVPTVLFDQLYSFDVDALMGIIPRPEDMAAERFEATAEELFLRIAQMADNAGATDEHRALNYLTVRYDAIYALTAQMHGRNFSLNAVDVRSSRLSGTRTVVDVVFTFVNRQTDFAEMQFVRVDTTEQFPFLVTRLAPYFER